MNVAIHSISSVRKPSGWRGQSYRHYLAAKGIKSPSPQRYFATQVNQAAKGNRDSEAEKNMELIIDGKKNSVAFWRKSLNARGVSSEEKVLLGLPPKEKKTSDFAEFIAARDGGVVSPQTDFGPAEELPEEEEPQFLQGGEEVEFEDQSVDVFDGDAEGIKARVEYKFTPPAFDPPNIATDPTADMRTPNNAFYKKSRRFR